MKLKKEYLKIDKVDGPLIFVSGIKDVFYGEIVEILVGDTKRKGKVIRIENENVAIQVFEGTSGLSNTNSAIYFTGKAFELNLNENILGRTFNGVGNPIDNGGEIYSETSYNINGRPINPVAREYPRDFIQTGISSIDTLTTLIRGQKLPIFSGNGISHNKLADQIVRQSNISKESGGKFAVVFAAIGVKYDDAAFFKKSFEESGASEKVVMFINLANDPIVERISTPRCALTAAEYLAFEKEYHVLVVMTDITSYCEALREISSAREEVPSRKGYPGYLYSDLASLYERAGILSDREGSITLLPILTMPNNDISHPIPDLTGYITEGQIVLSKDFEQSDIYPPIDVLPSLSRIMKDGIGEGYTRKDHPDVANQLFASYSKVKDIRDLAQIIGENDLSDVDKLYMKFGREFEGNFINQDRFELRSIEESLDLGWKMLSILPKTELDRLSSEVLEDNYIEK